MNYDRGEIEKRKERNVEAKEKGRVRGREKDTLSDHARLNFRVGGNGVGVGVGGWRLNGPEGHVVSGFEIP